ncbi:MAG: tetratricopeptide repeat protein [Azoarcus sp.]|jgi:tetratricopeptide (TPR) repeat protein|nr:tetratricopeptide repeat protein [Azoarcus sp.]
MGFIFRVGCEDLFIRLESADTLGMERGMDSTVVGAITTVIGKLIDFLTSFNQTRRTRKLLRPYYDKELVKKIAVSKKVSESYLWGVLDKIGLEIIENREDKALVLLEESADRFIEFKTKIDNLPESYQRISNLRKKAYWRLNNGSFDKVEKIYLKAVNRVTDESEKAATLACFAEFEMLQPNPASYRKAANNYAQAADYVADLDTKQTLEYRFNQAKTLYELGDEFGDNAALLKAVKQYKQLLSKINRTDDSELWATTQNNLGTALQSLGERESDTARLEEAVTAYREALKEYTRERVPLDWAMTQNNLGTALKTLGERESGTARLEEAAKAFRNALEIFRDNAPYYEEITANSLARVKALIDERKKTPAP